MKKIVLMTLTAWMGFASCVKDEVSDKALLPLVRDVIVTPAAPTADDAVIVSANILVPIGVVEGAVIEWSVDDVAKPAIPMTFSSDLYRATIPVQINGAKVSFKIIATNAEGAATVSAISTYTVGAPPVGSQSNVKLNEINGNGVDTDKYIELYNPTSDEINLEGMTITYGGTIAWTATAEYKIPAKGYFVIQGAKNTNVLNGGLKTGLSAGKGIHVILLTVSQIRADAFLRGAAQDAALTGTVSKDYSRILDGTGTWYLTDVAGTKGVTNGTSTSGLEVVSELQN